MTLTNEIANAVVPPKLPDHSLTIEGSARQAADGTLNDDDPLSDRILHWTDLIRDVLRSKFATILRNTELQYLPEERGEYDLGVGFVKVPARLIGHHRVVMARRQSPYVFGASLLNLMWPGEQSFPDGGVFDMGVYDPRLKGLPLIVDNASEIAHSAPNLKQATATCWATGSSPYPQILTSAHTFNWRVPPQNVMLEDNSLGYVANVAPFPIDAALVDLGGQRLPLNAVPLLTEPLPQPNERYSFEGLTSGVVQGRVTTVSVLPGVTSAMEPARVRLDTGGLPGDSGALIRSLKTGRGLSLYSGLLSTGTVDYHISQGIDQVAGYFAIQLLE